jgi:hypothetical protein
LDSDIPVNQEEDQDRNESRETPIFKNNEDVENEEE